jgi:molecular chaperone DnaJ
MLRNYFSDLELGPDASLDDVRKAYRRLARRFHPDVNPLDAQAEEAFRRIQEAFENLSTVTRIRKLRERLEGTSRKTVKPEIQKWSDFSKLPRPDQFVSQWRDEPSVKKNIKRPEEKLDFWIQLELSDQELKRGVSKRFRFSYEQPCEACRGSGGSSGSVKATCKRCAGLGFYLIERGAMHWKKTCDDCLGKGHIVVSPCRVCSGRGKVQNSEVLEVKIPKSPDLSKALVLRGLGHISYDGRKRGSLCVQLVQKL